MKYLMFVACLLFVGFGYGQDQIAPKYEQDGDKVKVTYFHSNGEVFQQGYFKDKKPEGLWVQFDKNGNNVSRGFYKEGKKDGVWLYWSMNMVKEVTYVDNRIVDVKEKEDTDLKLAVN